MGRDFGALVRARWEKGLHVCVGLDTDFDKIPACNRLAGKPVEESVVQYNRRIIQATADVVACYKPNRAFYAKHGLSGHLALLRTVQSIGELAPEVPVIGDGKWGDIGATNEAYAQEALGFGFDAVTLNPYLGEKDSLDRFFALEGIGCFVLCRTSSKGSAEFQNLRVLLPDFEQESAMPIPLYLYVAGCVKAWQANAKATLGLVVGATAPEELSGIRAAIGDDMPLLIPGVGKQGGSASDSARRARKNFLINNSSGCIFASKGTDFAEAARNVVLAMNEEIRAGLAAA